VTYPNPYPWVSHNFATSTLWGLHIARTHTRGYPANPNPVQTSVVYITVVKAEYRLTIFVSLVA